ncbi:MAG: aminoacyl-tRNA hydrolase [Oscillospiraceae bacterium]|jgi:PTH1 family peptidyl-tRNA hydrolase|nr:aminoacyl-tRNA hydrolase [Oscillospiraceae bacterium]
MFFKSKQPVWAIIFLGNPGEKYAQTRHNAGWIAANAVEDFTNKRIKHIKFKALTETVTLGGESVLLVKPQTFMNLSGESAGAAARFYKIPPERVVAVFDDMDLPLGKIRIRRGGSDGGHNGVKSLIQHLGTKEFPRIKLGIGKPPHPDYDVIDWVIGKLKNGELTAIQDAAGQVPAILETIIRDGMDSAMNKFSS